MSNPYIIEAGTAQHIGDRLQQNDRAALFVGARAPGYLMAVLADGGLSSAVAAEQLLHTSKQLFDDFTPGDEESVERIERLLRNIVEEAHTVLTISPIHSGKDPQSTLVVLVLTPGGTAVWAHVGDSRLYRFSGKQCLMRTNDAAYIDHLVNHAGLPLESATRHRSTALLINAVGSTLKAPFVSTGCYHNLQAGDGFMLCSDGLWHLFTDTELAAVVAKNPPRQAAGLLIEKATQRANGKGDNASMAIVRLVPPPKIVPDYTVEKMRRAV
jgi:serine/threonine protein phosphatase PrpC